MSLTVESKGEYCVKSGRKATEIENFKDPDAKKSKKVEERQRK